MKYEAEIDGRDVGIEVEDRNGRLLVRLGQRSYDVEVIRPEAGVYLLMVGDQVFEARAWTEQSDVIRVSLRGQIYDARIVDRKHRRAAAEHQLEGQARLTAPMPGKVVRLLLRQGDQVAAGQGVVVVEAMKMQNEVRSPKAGRVIELRVAQGDTVNANQLLAIVE
jgi:biotin carboxyl carrier protein